ncbi:MAG: cation:proton antiporter [Singulisphaera sp.]
MDHLTVAQFLGLLVVMLATARLCGALAKAIGQPTVLGELAAGVLLGSSVLGLVNPQVEVVHLLAELGVILLLFAIGVETDLRKLLQVGGTSAAVAAVGVVLPFALGYGACRLLASRTSSPSSPGPPHGHERRHHRPRPLRPGPLAGPESRHPRGAVIDDIIGLLILTVVAGLAQGEPSRQSSPESPGSPSGSDCHARRRELRRPASGEGRGPD